MQDSIPVVNSKDLRIKKWPKMHDQNTSQNNRDVACQFMGEKKQIIVIQQNLYA